MRQYSVWTAIPLSFFSAGLYRDVARHWGGVAFGYLLLIVALTAVPLAMWLTALGDGFIFEKGPQGVTPLESIGYRFANQVPPLRWEKGELKVNAKQPYRIQDEETGILIIIDTTGEITSLEQSGAHMLVTDDQVFIRKREHVTEVYDLKEIMEDAPQHMPVTLDANTARELVEITSNWLQENRTMLRTIAVIVLFMVIAFVSFISRLISVLLYALFSMLFGLVLKIPVDYVTLLRLACVAITPALVLDLALSLAAVEIPWILFILITLGYMFFAVRANRESTPTVN